MASLKSNQEKRELLWKHNLRYAMLLAGEAWGRRHAAQICTPEDLQAAALIGLWRAAQNFDASRGVKFISYAKWTVVRELNDTLRGSSSGFTIPPNAFRRFDALRVLETTGRNDGRFSDRTLAGMRAVKSSVSSLDKPGPEDQGEELTPHHRIASETDVVRDVETPELNEKTDRLLDSLRRFDDRLPDIMRDYYGLEGREKHTYDQIAVKHGVTRQRIEQMVSRALRRLRAHVAVKGISLQDLLTS